MVQIISQHGSQKRRVNRNPRHGFDLATRPFQIQPIMIAPVLPGETLKTLVHNSRVVSDPVKNPLIGWWQEYYYFYVKLTDLENRDDYREMMTDLSKDMSSLHSAADTKTYHYGGSINYVQQCMQRIVEEYFRDQDETWNSAALDGLPLASFNNTDFTHSAVLDDDYAGVIDVDLDEDADGSITARELNAQMATYQHLVQFGLTKMTYEDWLTKNGQYQAPDKETRPEELKATRNWTYPTNTIDPSDGSPSSALSWSINFETNKPKRFSEPGFVVGFSVTKPKVQMKNYDGAAASMLEGAMAWSHGMFSDNPELFMKKFAETAGPLSVTTDADGYWLDLKDLFLHGDQFRNYANTATDKNIVDLPTTDLSRLYPSATDVDALFVGANKEIRQNGLVFLSIAGNMVDTSPRPTGAQ